jgi:ubiquinol-cytochrome c reductase subunit 7
MFGVLGPSLASQVRASRSLYAWMKPIANWYASLAGYRKVGLKYDDLRMSFGESVFERPF